MYIRTCVVHRRNIFPPISEAVIIKVKKILKVLGQGGCNDGHNLIKSLAVLMGMEED